MNTEQGFIGFQRFQNLEPGHGFQGFEIEGLLHSQFLLPGFTMLDAFGNDGSEIFRACSHQQQTFDQGGKDTIRIGFQCTVQPIKGIHPPFNEGLDATFGLFSRFDAGGCDFIPIDDLFHLNLQT